jgi:hypothetical protein
MGCGDYSPAGEMRSGGCFDGDGGEVVLGGAHPMGKFWPGRELAEQLGSFLRFRFCVSRSFSNE